jgi:hypothetical protein
VMHYEPTKKGEPEKVSVVSQASVVVFICIDR